MGGGGWEVGNEHFMQDLTRFFLFRFLFFFSPPFGRESSEERVIICPAVENLLCESFSQGPSRSLLFRHFISRLILPVPFQRS